MFEDVVSDTGALISKNRFGVRRSTVSMVTK